MFRECSSGLWRNAKSDNREVGNQAAISCSMEILSVCIFIDGHRCERHIQWHVKVNERASASHRLFRDVQGGCDGGEVFSCILKAVVPTVLHVAADVADPPRPDHYLQSQLRASPIRQ